MNKPTLYYFEPTEFRQWFQHMDCRHLVLVDSLRHQWGRKVFVSPAEGSLGRKAGASTSQHNFDRYGLVRAGDYFPDGINDRSDLVHFVQLAVSTGFTGVGIYPHSHFRNAPRCMVHLDTRPDRQPGDPALWGAINNELGQREYVSYKGALEVFR